MELKKLLFIVFTVLTLGCNNKKGLRVTEEDIKTLDSLGYKVYEYKKDKRGKYSLDTIRKEIKDSLNIDIK